MRLLIDRNSSAERTCRLLRGTEQRTAHRYDKPLHEHVCRFMQPRANAMPAHVACRRQLEHCSFHTRCACRYRTFRDMRKTILDYLPAGARFVMEHFFSAFRTFRTLPPHRCRTTELLPSLDFLSFADIRCFDVTEYHSAMRACCLYSDSRLHSA